jgi:hypothetical protein
MPTIMGDFAFPMRDKQLSRAEGQSQGSTTGRPGRITLLALLDLGRASGLFRPTAGIRFEA